MLKIRAEDRVEMEMRAEERVEIQREEYEFERTMKWKSNANVQLLYMKIHPPMICPTSYDQCIRMR